MPKKKTSKVKESINSYKDDIARAYAIGYGRGWDDAYTIPKRFGAKTSASIGYGKGVKNRRKTDNYVNQYNRR